MAESGKIRVGDYILKHGIFATPCRVVYIFKTEEFGVMIETEDEEIMRESDILDENIKTEQELEKYVEHKRSS